MIEQINNWLKSPNGKYAFGLAIFMALASAEVKKKYGDYFKEVDPDEVKPSDPRFPMLINKVTSIYNIVRTNPEKYAEALAKIAAPMIQKHEDIQKVIALRQQVNELEDQVEELEASDEDKTTEIEQLEKQIETDNGTIEELKAKLKEKNIKVFDGKDLPAAKKKLYDRIKEIVPLMASLHADLRNESLTDAQRKEIAEQLCKLDDERRKHWDEIDAYLEDYNVTLTEEKKVEYSENPVIRGMQIGTRIKLLNGYVTRTTETIENHIKNEKPEMAQKARERLAKFETELNELNGLLGETK